MDVIDTRADLVRVAVLFERVEELHVTLRCFDRYNISVETLDGWENIIKVGVAKVGMSLELIADASCRKFERVNSPLEVSIPVRATERQLRYM